jgi:LuxR family transcriptional activator of conjugal transfer of Ti plasmids
MKLGHAPVQQLNIDHLSTAMPEKLIEPVYHYVQKLGFDYFSYLTHNYKHALAELPSAPLFINSARNNWGDRYLRRNFCHIDPVNHIARHQNLPIVWGGSRYLRSLPNYSRVVLEEARDHGLVSALSVPIHGPGDTFGVFTVSCNWPRRKFNRFVEDQIASVTLLGLQVHSLVDQFRLETSDIKIPELTLQERECLAHILEGRTQAEIGQIIYRSEPTVRFHIQKAVKKLNARNSVHAAFLAHQAFNRPH